MHLDRATAPGGASFVFVACMDADWEGRVSRLLYYQQAIARDIARTRIAHPPVGRALSPSPYSHGGSRVRVGSARRHALCRYEWVRDAHTTREPSCSRRGAYTSTRFFGRYFLWDSIVSLVHYEGMGFVIHGA